MPLIHKTCFLLPRSCLVKLLTCVPRQSGTSESAMFRPYIIILQKELASVRRLSAFLQGCDSRENLLFILSKELPQASSAASKSLICDTLLTADLPAGCVMICIAALAITEMAFPNSCCLNVQGMTSQSRLRDKRQWQPRETQHKRQ